MSRGRCDRRAAPDPEAKAPRSAAQGKKDLQELSVISKAGKLRVNSVPNGFGES